MFQIKPYLAGRRNMPEGIKDSDLKFKDLYLHPANTKELNPIESIFYRISMLANIH